MQTADIQTADYLRMTAAATVYFLHKKFPFLPYFRIDIRIIVLFH